MVSALTRLLWRDLWHLRAQAVAAVLVVGCGVTTFVAMRSTYLALLDAQQDYYASYRFADLFVHLKRAPLEVATRIATLPGGRTHGCARGVGRDSRYTRPDGTRDWARHFGS